LGRCCKYNISIKPSGQLSVLCTGAALLTLIANRTRGTLGKQAGRPQPLAAGCTPQQWSSPQGGLTGWGWGWTESQHRLPKAKTTALSGQEKPLKAQSGVGRQMFWGGSGPGWG